MKYEVQSLTSLEDIDAQDWNQLVPPSSPFLRHEFINGLEKTNCVGSTKSGWVPRHLVVVDSESKLLLAGLPLYEKYDSYGEYIFDWAWARAAHGAGIPYYPKLVSAIPFTPATCSKLLINPTSQVSVETLKSALLTSLTEIARSLGVSSTHILFHNKSECTDFKTAQLRTRKSFQYHWFKQAHWSCFDDYLKDMRSSAKKMVRRERRIAASHNLKLRTLRGPELTEQHWHALWEFYRRTTYFKGAIPYLTEAFFLYLKTDLQQYVVATFAEDENEPVAGSLFFCDGCNLYGRYWGTKLFLDCMHFELCYYQPIEWAIQNGITRFEAGAQGDHKLKRGFLPHACYSSHWIKHPGLGNSVYQFLEQEALGIESAIQQIATHSPFKTSHN